jgi:hypothetical protein
MLLKFLLLVALSVFVFAANVEQCGRVLDGGVAGEDIQFQPFNTSIQANWNGFEKANERPLRYEWAVISGSQASKFEGVENCRLFPGFRGIPDSMGWRTVEGTSASSKLSLKTGNKYFVVLRITYSNGLQVFANSNGITITESESPSTPLKRNKFTRSADVIPAVLQYPGEPVFFPNGAIFVGSNNPIDQANRNAAGKVSVAERLNQIYGLPQYAQDERANTIFTTLPESTVGVGYGVNFQPFPTPFPRRLVNDDDDDGDHVNDGAIIGIAVGVTAFFCIMVMCVIVIAFIVTGLRRRNNGGSGGGRGRGGDGEF